MSKIKYTLLMSSVLSVLSLQSAHAQMTVEKAIQSAMQEHPSIESARAFVEASKKDHEAQRSAYYPELSIGLTVARQFGDNATTRGLSVTRGEGYSNFAEGTATLRQPIFDGFGTDSRVLASSARLRAADMDLADAHENLALRVVQSYINVMRTHTALEMLKSQALKINDYLQRIKVAVDDGASDEAEYQQALDVQAVIEGVVADYEGQAASARAQFYEATGVEPLGDLKVPRPNIALIAPNIKNALEQARLSHPSIKSAQFSASAVQQGIQTEQSLLYPKLDGELSYLKSDKRDLLGGEVVDARATMRMNWSFETGGGAFSRMAQRRHEWVQAKARQNEIARQIESAIKRSYSDFETAKKQLETTQRRLRLNEKLFDTFETQFDGARISLLQLMQADNQVFNINLEKLNAEYGVLLSQYTVLSATGKLQDSVRIAQTQ